MQASFCVEKKLLLEMLGSMQPICTRRTTVETTSHVLFHVGSKELTLKGTDLEISLQTSGYLEQSDLTQSQSFLVPGKRMFDLVKELEDSIACELSDSQLTLRSGSVHFDLLIKPAQEFPPFPDRIENLMQFEGSFLLDMINKVAFLVPQNNANPSLNGLYFELSPTAFKMTSTDGHCLAQVTSTTTTLPEEKRWLLPRRAIFELKKLLEINQKKTVFLGTCDNQLVFSSETFNFFTKLLTDKFPQYEAILKKDGFQAATVDRSSFIKTLRRSACLLSGQFIATKFNFDQDAVNVAMTNKDVGSMQESIPVTGLAQDTSIRFYAPYLLSGLQVFNDKELSFSLGGPSKPILFEAGNERTQVTYLVMPVLPTSNQTPQG